MPFSTRASQANNHSDVKRVGPEGMVEALACYGRTFLLDVSATTESATTRTGWCRSSEWTAPWSSLTPAKVLKYIAPNVGEGKVGLFLFRWFGEPCPWAVGFFFAAM